NNKGETILHPLLPTDNEYFNRIFTSPVTPDISLLEPNEFTQFIKQDMILGKTGYKKITAHVRQIAGDSKRNGYLLVEQDLIYFYYPLINKELSLGIVVYTRPNIPEPLVPTFGFEDVPE